MPPAAKATEQRLIAFGGDSTSVATQLAVASRGSHRLEKLETTNQSPLADDVELLAGVRRGDRLAFRALYDRYAPELLALCQRILHQRADAEDAVADVFWEVWQRRERYDATRGGARPYLMTLARSRAIDRLRSHAARPEVRASGAILHPHDGEIVGYVRSPEEGAADAELRIRVAEAFASLDARQREAMELAYYGGLSHQQIADRLAAPLGTVKTHIRKGLDKLRFALKSYRDNRA